MSGDINIVMTRSAVDENVGVAVGIMSVCCRKLKLHRPAENSDFSMEGAIGFPGNSRYWKELTSRGKRHNIRNWTAKEQVLTVFLNFFPFRRYS